MTWTEIQDVEDEIDIETSLRRSSVFTLTEAATSSGPPVSEYTAIQGRHGSKGITTREGRRAIRSPNPARPPRVPTSSTSCEQGERVQAMLHYRENGGEQLYLMMVTRNGTVKRLPVDTLQEPPQ